MKAVIFPYKMGSQSAKALAQGLGALRVYPDRGYRPKANHLIINWGNSQWPSWYNSDRHYMLNHPAHVQKAANKLAAFQSFSQYAVSCPEWTTDYNVVTGWLQENPDLVVYGRETLTGHSGAGIVLITPQTRRINCPLYTRQVKIKKEYRVHVFNEEVIDVTQKRHRSGVESNSLIRNLDNGWVFTREDMIVPECVTAEAIKAVQALGLDFGAVDVGYNQHYDKAYIFEVNTACGLEGTTLQRYTEAIENYVNHN